MIYKITQEVADKHRGKIHYRSNQYLRIHVELGVRVDIVIRSGTHADVYHDGIGGIMHEKLSSGDQFHRGEGSCLHKGKGWILYVLGIFAMHHGEMPRTIKKLY